MKTEIKPELVTIPAVKTLDSKTCHGHTRTFTEPLTVGAHTFKCEACGEDFVVVASQQFAPPPSPPRVEMKLQDPASPPKPS